MKNIFEIIQKVTVNCTNDKSGFIVDDRIKAIRELLSGTKYRFVYDGKLVKIYGKNKPEGTIKIISSHIDCVKYDRFFAVENGEYYEGIFDNALTNAFLIKAMIGDKFRDDVFVAFTGDEESGFGGVREIVGYATDAGITISEAIVTDVTFENYATCGVSYENYFNQAEGFKDEMLKKIEIPEAQVSFIKDAWPDEAYEYKRLGVLTYTLCIPTASMSEDKMDMHTGKGLRVKKTAVDAYYKALVLSV